MDKPKIQKVGESGYFIHNPSSSESSIAYNEGNNSVIEREWDTKSVEGSGGKDQGEAIGQPDQLAYLVPGALI